MEILYIPILHVLFSSNYVILFKENFKETWQRDMFILNTIIIGFYSFFLISSHAYIFMIFLLLQILFMFNTEYDENYTIIVFYTNKMVYVLIFAFNTLMLIYWMVSYLFFI